MPRAVPLSLRKSLFGGACISLQPLILNAISIPVMAYLIRRLGPYGYGQWVVATALISFSAILANLGLRAAFVRALAKDPGTAATMLAEQLGLRLLLSGLAVLAALIACFSLGYSHVILQCTAIAGLGLILTTFASTLADVLQAFGRLPALAAVNLVSGLALTAASVVVAALGGGPASIAFAYLLGPVIAATALAKIVRRDHFPITMCWNVPRYRVALKESRSFAAQQLLSVAGTNVQMLMLPRLVGTSGFGFFTAGSLLGTRLAVLPDGLCAAAYPAIAKTYQQSPRAGARLMFLYAGVMLLITVPVAAGAMWVANPLARLLFPHQWAICEQVIRITIWLVPIIGAECIMGYSLNAAGKEAAHARALVPAGLCGFLLTVILVSRFGIAGACWASLLCSGVRMAFMSPCFIRTFVPPMMQRSRDPETDSVAILISDAIPENATTLVAEPVFLRKAG